MLSPVVRALSVTTVLIAGLLSRSAAAQSPSPAAERSILILVTKERLLMSTDGNMPAGVSRKELEGDGLLIRCKSCAVDRQDGEKKSFTFRCQGDVLVENSLFTIRAETVTGEGSRLVAVGTADKDAELWAIGGADKKKKAFTSGSRIRFDAATKSVEVENGGVLDLGQRP